MDVTSPCDRTPAPHETPASHARRQDRLVGWDSGESQGSCDEGPPPSLPASPPRLPWHPDLHDANFHACLLGIPGRRPYAPVHPACFMLDLATRCNISVMAVAFGASYFQRVMEVSPNESYGRFMCGGRGIQNGPGLLCGHAATEADAQLLAVYAACVSLAAKNFDCCNFRPARQLPEMLRYILNVPTAKRDALDLEMRCMLLLDYRLGPRLLD
jgi:hypothetical protein